MGSTWEWGEEIGGNCWGSMSEIGFKQASHEKFAGPGHRNDLDMLVAGMIGWSANLHPGRLTPNEQATLFRYGVCSVRSC